MVFPLSTFEGGEILTRSGDCQAARQSKCFFIIFKIIASSLNVAPEVRQVPMNMGFS